MLDVDYRRILDVCADAVVVADRSQAIVYVNTASEALLRWPAGELVGQSLSALVPERLRAAHAEGFARYLETGTPRIIGQPMRFAALCRDGREVEVELIVSAPTDAGYFVATLRDARQRVAVEQAIRARDEFLSSVSHDLRGPLTTIGGLAQLLQLNLSRKGTLDLGQATDKLAGISAATSRMTAMIDELLDVTRLQIGKPLELVQRPVDLIDLVNQVVARQEQQAAGSHVIRIDTSLPELVGFWDTGRLERVVANLLSNAIKYSPDGGSVAVVLERDADGQAPEAVLTVRDSGLGIPGADLPFIFDLFRRGANVTGRIPGTGIGLASARHIIEQHGGAIFVESAEGEGATFTVRLPL